MYIPSKSTVNYHLTHLCEGFPLYEAHGIEFATAESEDRTKNKTEYNVLP